MSTENIAPCGMQTNVDNQTGIASITCNECKLNSTINPNKASFVDLYNAQQCRREGENK